MNKTQRIDVLRPLYYTKECHTVLVYHIAQSTELMNKFAGPPARRNLRYAAAVSADGRPSSRCLCGHPPRDGRRPSWQRPHEHHHPDQRSNCMRLRSTSSHATDEDVGPCGSRTRGVAREFSTGRRSHHPDALPLPALDVAVIL